MSQPEHDKTNRQTQQDDEPRTWTLLELVRWSTAFFEKHGIETPRLDTEILVGHTLGLSRLQLLTEFDRVLTPDELADYKQLVLRRARRREPVAYLLGHREFWSLDLEVSPAVLVPRPETERLVELALERLAGRPSPRIADVGTGSGAIALAVATERPDAALFATDLSPDALAVARRNATRLGLADRVSFYEGDLLDALTRVELLGALDAVLSNPPYIGEHELPELAPELDHEPRQALLGGGPDGLDILRRLAPQALRWLAPGGHLLCEIGSTQRQGACDILTRAGFVDVDCIRDYSALDRVVLGRRPA